jgi:hypothetical protein
LKSTPPFTNLTISKTNDADSTATVQLHQRKMAVGQAAAVSKEMRHQEHLKQQLVHGVAERAAYAGMPARTHSAARLTRAAGGSADPFTRQLIHTAASNDLGYSNARQVGL